MLGQHLAKDYRQALNQQQRKPTQKAASATTVEEPKEVTAIVLCEEVDMGKLQSSVRDGKLRLVDGAETQYYWVHANLEHRCQREITYQ